MMELEQGVAVAIEYEKKNGEVVERFIVPVNVPKTYMRAIDVSDDEYGAQEIEDVEIFVDEYKQYLADHMAQAFSFEDFLSHSYGVEQEFQWKTFTLDNVMSVDEIAYPEEDDEDDGDEDDDGELQSSLATIDLDADYDVDDEWPF